MKKNFIPPILTIGILFFVFGFITWLNATLIPFLKTACELTTFEAYLVTTAFYISYFIMSIPSSAILEKVGYKRGMSLGLFVMAVGSILFIPAALSREYSLFLIGLFVQGLGISLLQTAANPYVTIVGPVESAAKRMSIMGVANKVAGILSPIILGALIFSDADSFIDSLSFISGAEREVALQELALRVIYPYAWMALALCVLAAGILYSGLPDIEDDKEEEKESTLKKIGGALQQPYLVLGFFAIFFYVGVEVIAVDTLNLYGEQLGFEADERQFFSSMTLGAMLLGYFFGIFTIPRFFSQKKVLMWFVVLGIVFTTMAMFTTGLVSVVMITLLGFANAIMWPAIWPLAIEGAGKYTKIGSALLVMGVAGGAILPLLYAKANDLISDRLLLTSSDYILFNSQGNIMISESLAYWVMIPCYLFIGFYALKGHKIGKKITF